MAGHVPCLVESPPMELCPVSLGWQPTDTIPHTGPHPEALTGGSASKRQGLHRGGPHPSTHRTYPEPSSLIEMSILSRVRRSALRIAVREHRVSWHIDAVVSLSCAASVNATRCRVVCAIQAQVREKAAYSEGRLIAGSKIGQTFRQGRGYMIPTQLSTVPVLDTVYNHVAEGIVSCKPAIQQLACMHGYGAKRTRLLRGPEVVHECASLSGKTQHFVYNRPNM
eukprot:60811-Chlamydomonas_euryale.AAC.6